MAASVEQIVNQALRRISYPTPIGSIYEGSRAARVAVEVYGQARDALLRSADWPFARQCVALALLKTAPVGGYVGVPWTSAYPPLPWIYEYAYPAQCVMVRSVRTSPAIVPVFDPRPHVFTLGNDTATGAQVVLTNLADAQAIITGQVTNPGMWEPGFTDAMVAALALRLQEALQPESQAVKDRATEEQATAEMADGRRG